MKLAYCAQGGEYRWMLHHKVAVRDETPSLVNTLRTCVATVAMATRRAAAIAALENPAIIISVTSRSAAVRAGCCRRRLAV